jgi:putrescine transport system ATP-binding protein
LTLVRDPPEKMRSAADAKPSEARSDMNAAFLRAEVWDIAYLGDMSIYHVELDSGAVHHPAAQTPTPARLGRAIRFATWDDEVWLIVAPMPAWCCRT